MAAKLTPMLKQYLEIKKEHKDDILFFRMGDFYEMFFEDAHIASKVLDIALTSRQNDVPMCGIPYHAAESYMARMIKAGYRVAICEQMETVPSQGTIVRREVVRIITPGTLVESNLLQSDDNNFLGSIVITKDKIGLSFADISTGDFFISQTDKSFDLFRGEITRFLPKEIVFKSTDQAEDAVFEDYLNNLNIPLYKLNDWYYDQDYLTDIIQTTFKIKSLKGLELNSELEILSAGSILQYLTDTQKKSVEHIKNPRKIISGDYMLLDDATINNLELVKNQHDNTKNQTLFSVLNYTKTAIGRRTLERNILQPLLNQEKINNRLDIVEFLTEYRELISFLQDELKLIHDLERLTARFTVGKAFARDFKAVSQSLAHAQIIKKQLQDQPLEQLQEISLNLPNLSKLAEEIEQAICDDPALTPEQGRVIRAGFNQELDHYYQLKKDSKNWLLNYQEEEKARVGINTLKIKYNRVVGYFIEISKGQVAKVPTDYLRKQTLANSERFTTEKLQKFEADISSSADNILKLEKAIIAQLHQKLLSQRQKLQDLAVLIGETDFYCSLATAAIENQYVRANFNDQGTSAIKEGRHPIVEKYYSGEIFIPNDIKLDTDENNIILLTGPNMSGKSTFIRMSAIIQLMAQIGSFVPVTQANLSLVDRIFTRIGASDNISRGESTFLVEMNETAIILNNATDKSLIIMDEVGRGTSTYDGLSIAWAIVKYIQNYIKAKTLFATHYHELTELGQKKGINNYNVMVKEGIEGIEFLHKVVPGAANRSYGIHVAKLAGIPKTIIEKADKKLAQLENQKGKRSNSKNANKAKPENESEKQLDIFNANNHLVVQAIKKIDVNSITPMDALNEIYRLKKLIDN